MRRLPAILLGALALTSSAGADGGPSPGVTVGWDRILARDGSVRYVALPARGATVVAAIAPDGGRVQRFTTVRGSYGIPMVGFDGTTDGLSADGRTLVLSGQLVGPSPRASRFALLDLGRMRVRETFTLRGAFSFDALSPSGKTLFLIEHVGAGRDMIRYRVRAFDLSAGRLLPGIIADRRSATTTMRGQPVTRAYSANGVWAYTLYGGGEHAFVHALDTVRREAVCIGLPWRGNVKGIWDVRMTASADGRRLVLRRRAGGWVATIDLKRFRTLSAARLGR